MQHSPTAETELRDELLRSVLQGEFSAPLSEALDALGRKDRDAMRAVLGSLWAGLEGRPLDFFNADRLSALLNYLERFLRVLGSDALRSWDAYCVAALELPSVAVQQAAASYCYAHLSRSKRAPEFVFDLMRAPQSKLKLKILRKASEVFAAPFFARLATLLKEPEPSISSEDVVNVLAFVVQTEGPHLRALEESHCWAQLLRYLLRVIDAELLAKGLLIVVMAVPFLVRKASASQGRAAGAAGGAGGGSMPVSGSMTSLPSPRAGDVVEDAKISKLDLLLSLFVRALSWGQHRGLRSPVGATHSMSGTNISSRDGGGLRGRLEETNVRSQSTTSSTPPPPLTPSSPRRSNRGRDKGGSSPEHTASREEKQPKLSKIATLKLTRSRSYSVESSLEKILPQPPMLSSSVRKRPPSPSVAAAAQMDSAGDGGGSEDSDDDDDVMRGVFAGGGNADSGEEPDARSSASECIVVVPLSPLPPPPESLRHAVRLLFRCLYAYFPWDLLHYLRTESHNAVFRQRLVPLLESLEFNPALVHIQASGSGTQLDTALNRVAIPPAYFEGSAPQALAESGGTGGSEKREDNTNENNSSAFAALSTFVCSKQIDFGVLDALVAMEKDIYERAETHTIQRTFVGASGASGADAGAGGAGDDGDPATATSVSVLQELHRNELLFERYLRNHQMNRLNEMQKYLVEQERGKKLGVALTSVPAASAHDAEAAALRAVLEKQTKKQQQEREAHQQWQADMVQQLEKTKREFTEQAELCRDLTREKGELRAAKTLLVEEAHELKSENLQLKLDVQELTTMRGRVGELEGMVESMKKEVVLWERKYNYFTSAVLNGELQRRDILRDDLANKLVDAEMRVSSVTEQLRAARLRETALQAENVRQVQATAQLQQLLELNQHVCASKLAALEKKYSTIKFINEALHQRLAMMLQAAGGPVDDEEFFVAESAAFDAVDEHSMGASALGGTALALPPPLQHLDHTPVMHSMQIHPHAIAARTGGGGGGNISGRIDSGTAVPGAVTVLPASMENTESDVGTAAGRSDSLTRSTVGTPTRVRSSLSHQIANARLANSAAVVGSTSAVASRGIGRASSGDADGLGSSSNRNIFPWASPASRPLLPDAAGDVDHDELFL